MTFSELSLDNWRDLFRAADAQLQAGNLAVATTLYNALLARTPDDPDLLHRLGIVAGHRVELPAQPELRGFLARGMRHEGLRILDEGDQWAALIAALDLVVSVDSMPLHLAGVLGVPAWAMIPTACDARWMIGRTDSTWYSGVRLFRQSRPGDWGPVVQAMALHFKA